MSRSSPQPCAGSGCERRARPGDLTLRR